jgi:hypothetical protein
VLSVQGPGSAQAGQVASSRRLAWALTIAAMLLVAVLAAAPARAQEAPPVDAAPADGSTGSGDATQVPPSDPPADPGTTTTTPPAGDPGSTPVDPTPTPSEPPPSEDTPGSGDISNSPASGTGDSPTAHKQPARDQGSVPAAESTPAIGPTATSDAGKQPPAPAAAGGSDSWLGQDVFVLDRRGGDHGSGGARTVRRRFAGLVLLGTTSSAKRMEASDRQSNETAKVSPLGAGAPTPGKPLPGQNPFFNLLSGSGGIGGSLVLMTVLAVLGAAFVLPRDRFKALRTPSVTWRPLAYVPPIELPG